MKHLQHFSASPELYLGLGLLIVFFVWFIQRKRIKNRLKHYGRHQLINVDGKPIQQLVEPSMRTKPFITFSHSNLRWVKLKILNENIHYNIENEYKFIGHVFEGKVITHEAKGNWITFYFEKFKDEIPLPLKRRKPFVFGVGVDGLNNDLSINIHNNQA